jgi:hypothetical protein
MNSITWWSAVTFGYLAKIALSSGSSTSDSIAIRPSLRDLGKDLEEHRQQVDVDRLAVGPSP